MKIVTYNVNGIRSRLAHLLVWLERESPDIACLQELKAESHGFPMLDIRALYKSFGPTEVLKGLDLKIASGRTVAVIGATEKDGGTIKERPVTPGDLAATIYHHMGVPLDATYPDTSGRPRHIVENGRPIRELL